MTKQEEGMVTREQIREAAKAFGMVITKQEKIKEGMAERLYKEAPGWKNYQYVPFKDAPEVVREQYLREADKWLIWLDSQGVVMQVERELPEYSTLDDPVCCAGCHESEQVNMLEAGFVATESLIEGKERT